MRRFWRMRQIWRMRKLNAPVLPHCKIECANYGAFANGGAFKVASPPAGPVSWARGACQTARLPDCLINGLAGRTACSRLPDRLFRTCVGSLKGVDLYTRRKCLWALYLWDPTNRFFLCTDPTGPLNNSKNSKSSK